MRAVVGALLALLMPFTAGAPTEPLAPRTNVPDAVTRESGLRVAPMPRVAQTYAANCQGCHGEVGISAREIPTLVGRVGYFVRSAEGRRYLVQVPNVALNPSSDADIAAVLNWVLMTYSRAQLPPHFRPYTAEEVGKLRKVRIDVAAERRRVVRELLATGLIPSADVLALPRITPY
jgi:mono/diheme cytochrome c family protein